MSKSNLRTKSLNYRSARGADQKVSISDIKGRDAKKQSDGIKPFRLTRSIVPSHRARSDVRGHKVHCLDAWLAMLPPDLESDGYEQGLAVASSLLVNPNVSYKFRLTTLTAVTSTAGGVITGAFAYNPNGTTQFSSLSSLFDNVRIVDAEITWINMNPSTELAAAGVTLKPAILIGTNNGLTASVPASAADIQDNADSELFSTSQAVPFRKRASRMNNEYALCSAPVPGPYAGCYGQFNWYQSTASVTTKYADVLFEGIYEFTARS